MWEYLAFEKGRKKKKFVLAFLTKKERKKERKKENWGRRLERLKIEYIYLLPVGGIMMMMMISWKR